jgi:hypothetical protein
MFIKERELLAQHVIDNNCRLAFLPLIKASISEIFPKLDTHFITISLSQAYNCPYLITGNNFEHDKTSIAQHIKKHETAIDNRTPISFQYNRCHISRVK